MTLGQNSPGRDLKDRYLVLGGVMLLGLLVLAVRTYRLQVTRYDEYSAKSAANFVKEVRLRADRGSILDASGQILAENRPSFDLFLTPAFCQKCPEEVLPRMVALLSWDPTIDVDALATAAGLGAARVRAALTQLGTAGRVGYDVAEAGYFHRTLPYSADAVALMNPRLAAARALAAAGAVTIDGDVAVVGSYRVRDARSCTCEWWARHRGERGPCKHALAVRLVRDSETAEVPA